MPTSGFPVYRFGPRDPRLWFTRHTVSAYTGRVEGTTATVAFTFPCTPPMPPARPITAPPTLAAYARRIPIPAAP